MAEISAEEREQMLAAYVRLAEKHKLMMLHLDFDTLLALISHVQLALRHPGNKGHAAQRARRWLDEVIAVLERQDPLVGKMLRLGDSPDHDVQFNRPEEST
jgi:hypothetical protein